MFCQSIVEINLIANYQNLGKASAFMLMNHKYQNKPVLYYLQWPIALQCRYILIGYGTFKQALLTLTKDF